MTHRLNSFHIQIRALGYYFDLFLVKYFPKLCRCLQCKEIDIRSNGAARVKVSHYLGTFKLVDGIYMDGRPVYRKDDGKFLNKDGKATFAIRSYQKLIHFFI